LGKPDEIKCQASFLFIGNVDKRQTVIVIMHTTVGRFGVASKYGPDYRATIPLGDINFLFVVACRAPPRLIQHSLYLYERSLKVHVFEEAE
jgi:hypothetical protein